MCGVLPAFEKDGPLTAEEMEQRSIAKSKMLGNIKFIGMLLVRSGIGYHLVRNYILLLILSFCGSNHVQNC